MEKSSQRKHSSGATKSKSGAVDGVIDGTSNYPPNTPLMLNHPATFLNSEPYPYRSGLRVKHLDDGSVYGHNYNCWFSRRFRYVALAQIILGIVLTAAGLYTHFPIFSGSSELRTNNGTSPEQRVIVDRGFRLMPGEDRLWYATWIGCVNIFVGIMGRFANKRSIHREMHIKFRRGYFLFNAFFCLYCNGIGIVAYIITLSHNVSLIEPHSNYEFTSIMAFVCLFLLFPLFLLNILATIYQALATRQCRCWVCDPKSASKLALLMNA